jgi:hypothetical protein
VNRREFMTSLGGCAVMLTVTGCSTFGRKRDWYDGPAELREPTREAINHAIHHLSRETGRDLKWDWNRNTIRIRIIQPDRQGPLGPTNVWNGQNVLGRAIPGEIILPVGFGQGTFQHEIGHVVMFANGITDTDYHHSLNYFKRNIGRQTYP